MPQKPDLAKRESWRSRLEEFGRGNERIVDFCRRLSVPVWSFYYWQQRLRAPALSERQRVQGNGRGTTRRDRLAHHDRLAHRAGRARTQRRLNFVPIQVTGGRSVEVYLPNGTRVMVPCQDRDAIGAVIAALVSDPPEHRPC